MHGHLWSPPYFCASCGGAPLAIVRQYIEQQKGPPKVRVRAVLRCIHPRRERRSFLQGTR
ncbi:transposase [Streptomyces sp. HUAS TT11]|uniref:transposase n=1 Tax=Streptomyces sp. HUAS TT11 TaxID=3447508 RepID=UPI003F65C0A8